MSLLLTIFLSPSLCNAHTLMLTFCTCCAQNMVGGQGVISST